MKKIWFQTKPLSHYLHLHAEPNHHLWHVARFLREEGPPDLAADDDTQHSTNAIHNAELGNRRQIGTDTADAHAWPSLASPSRGARQ